MTQTPNYNRNRGFGVYVHLPYCVHRCSYCDFYSLTKYDEGDFPVLTQALKKELLSGVLWMRTQYKELPKVTSVFMGGGTPSLIPGKLIRQILLNIQELLPFSEEIEITLEANPETVTQEFCEKLLLSPVNRVSLGVQSFKKRFLEALERRASPESILFATDRLKEHGYRNFSLDLIFGIPGQTVGDIEQDIRQARELNPKHMSAYQLTLKPAHPLYTQLPTPDSSVSLYEAVEKEMHRVGMNQYEISNYSLPGFECRHNLLYWDGGDYLGIGPSSSSRFFLNGNFVHHRQVADLSLYLSNPKFEPSRLENTNQNQTVLEAAFLELRQNAGVDLGEFLSRYGYDLKSSAKYQNFIKEGFLTEEKNRLRLTPRGRLMADAVTEQLVDFKY